MPRPGSHRRFDGVWQRRTLLIDLLTSIYSIDHRCNGHVKFHPPCNLCTWSFGHQNLDLTRVYGILFLNGYHSMVDCTFDHCVTCSAITLCYPPSGDVLFTLFNHGLCNHNHFTPKVTNRPNHLVGLPPSTSSAALSNAVNTPSSSRRCQLVSWRSQAFHRPD